MWLGRAYAKATVFTIDNPAAAVRIVYGVFLQTEPTGKEEATPVPGRHQCVGARMPHGRLEPAGLTKWSESLDVNYRDDVDFLLVARAEEKVDVPDHGPDQSIRRAKVAAEAKGYRYAR